MSDDPENSKSVAKRMAKPPTLKDPGPARNWLSSKVEEINEKAAAKVQDARNSKLASFLRGGELSTKIQHQQAEYTKAVARNEEESLQAEIELEKEKVAAERAALFETAEKARAEAEHVVTEYEAKKAKAEAEKAEADYRKRQAEKKLEKLNGVSNDDDRQALLKQKIDLETEISLYEQQLSELLKQDGEKADAMRRGVEGQLEQKRAELKEVLSALQDD